jgi:hypothetical protein
MRKAVCDLGVTRQEAQRVVKMAGSRLRSGKMLVLVPVTAWLLQRLAQMGMGPPPQLPPRPAQKLGHN